MTEKTNFLEKLFKIAYTLLLIEYYVKKVPTLTAIIKHFKLIAIIILLFCCIIQSKKYNIKTIITIYMLIIINALVCFTSNDTTILLLFLIILSLKNIDLIKLLKFDISLKIMIIILLYILSKFGMTNEGIFFRDGIMRYAFGFTQPNTFGDIVASVIIEYIYINQNRMNIIKSICILSISLLVSHYSDSRTSLVISLIIILCCIFKDTLINKIIYKKPMKFIIENSWIIFTLITILFTILYQNNNSFGIWINDALSNRIKYIIRFLNNYNIKLFGNKLVFVYSLTARTTGLTYAVLDNAYIRMILQYGISTYLIMYYYTKKLIQQAYKNTDTIFICILFVLLMRGIAEHGCYVVFSNVFLVYINKVIYTNEYKKGGNYEKI